MKKSGCVLIIVIGFGRKSGDGFMVSMNSHIQETTTEVCWVIP